MLDSLSDAMWELNDCSGLCAESVQSISQDLSNRSSSGNCDKRIGFLGL